MFDFFMFLLFMFSVIGAVWFVISISIDPTEKWGYIGLGVCAVVFSIVFYYLRLGADERIKQEEAEVISWTNKGCPVYKSECGSKSKYACERKAAVVGKNQVGDIFVEAYAMCPERISE